MPLLIKLSDLKISKVLEVTRTLFEGIRVLLNDLVKVLICYYKQEFFTPKSFTQNKIKLDLFYIFKVHSLIVILFSKN